jgi:hypothetical protein
VAETRAPLFVLAASGRLRARSVLHLHALTLTRELATPSSRRQAPTAAARLESQQPAQHERLCFLSDAQRALWLAAVVRAAERVPARFCAACRQLVDLALCTSASLTRGAVRQQLAPADALPESRFLVVGAEHCALYKTPAAFGSRMALGVWHATACEIHVVGANRFELVRWRGTC